MNFTSIGNISVSEWIPNRNICIKKGKINTLQYLDSINYKECATENICQYYFCKLNNQSNNTCPIADIKINYGFDASNFNFANASKTDPSSGLAYSSQQV